MLVDELAFHPAVSRLAEHVQRAALRSIEPNLVILVGPTNALTVDLKAAIVTDEIPVSRAADVAEASRLALDNSLGVCAAGGLGDTDAESGLTADTTYDVRVRVEQRSGGHNSSGCYTAWSSAAQVCTGSYAPHSGSHARGNNRLTLEWRLPDYARLPLCCNWATDENGNKSGSVYSAASIRKVQVRWRSEDGTYDDSRLVERHIGSGLPPATSVVLEGLEDAVTYVVQVSTIDEYDNVLGVMEMTSVASTGSTSNPGQRGSSPAGSAR